MSPVKHITLYYCCILACMWGVSSVAALAVNKCQGTKDYCHDRSMHPDLKEQQQQPMTKAGAGARVNEAEYTNEYWRTQGAEFVRSKLSETLNKKRAKNVIMFLGDGMGLTTVAAARNLIGGEEKQFSFEEFPHVGLSKTYSVDKIVPDSACTATAYLCGVKAQEGTIGVNGHVDLSDCNAMLDTQNHVDSIAKWAQDAGKWTGVVTTTRITHASPAGVYAHTSDRDWENDSEVKLSCGTDSNVQDIAYQLIRGTTGSNLKLIMGGGRRNFVDSSISPNGHRSDGLDLISEFRNANSRNVYVTTRDELMNADLQQANRLMGLFNDNHLLYHLETNATTNQPTLEDMTRKAIEYLSQNEEGYFIFIEGGRIDHGHHDNMARFALDETVEFSKAIAAARELTSEDDTLIVVTADHSHSFSYAGYPYRGNDIFGSAPQSTQDGKPYMTLSYANGPSAPHFYDATKKERVDPTSVVTGKPDDEFPAGVPLGWETHGGDDVAVYGLGPWAHLLTGVYEQNTIPHIMAYASCIGNGLKMCDTV